MTYPDGRTVSYTYDANGNLTGETDALGNTVRYEYTPEGWLEKVIKADGTEITFEYDRTGNMLTQHAGDEYTISSGYNELGQVTRVSSEAGTIEYQYDDRGYLISVRNVNGETISYTYDQYGNKESMTYPSFVLWRGNIRIGSTKDDVARIYGSFKSEMGIYYDLYWHVSFQYDENNTVKAIILS